MREEVRKYYEEKEILDYYDNVISKLSDKEIEKLYNKIMERDAIIRENEISLDDEELPF